MTANDFQLIQDIAHIKARTDEIHDRLFNPHTGIEKRVDDLEATRDRGKGIMWMLGSVVSLLGGTEIVHLLKSKP